MNDEQLLRYGRQILLPEIDLHGQQKIKDTAVLVIGLGGLGSAISFYLAAAGVGRLLLNDFDVVDKSNLQRQIVHQEASVGMNKAQSARQTLQYLNSDIEIQAIEEKLDRQALLELAASCNIIVDGSDNFATRHMINEISLTTGKPLVSGAAIRLEGQVSVFNMQADSPCYACLYGSDHSDDNMTCSENGVLAPLVGIIGSIQAMETIKLIVGFGETLDKRLLVLDGKTMNFRTMKLAQDPACVCHQLRSATVEG
jgi:molybdopterin-synthase adenylyltransferase